MAGQKLPVDVDVLVERAQSGLAAEVLAEVATALADGTCPGEPALHFAGAGGADVPRVLPGARRGGAAPGAAGVQPLNLSAHLLLLARRGDAAASAGLSYGHTLSLALWRERARRLAAAEEVLRHERLRRDHEEVSRDSDVDALTGLRTGHRRRPAQADPRRPRPPDGRRRAARPPGSR